MPMPFRAGGLPPGRRPRGSRSPLTPLSPGPRPPRSLKGLYYRRARKVGALGASPAADLTREVRVNVGGRRYALPWSTLDAFPLSRLSKLKFCRSHEEIAQLCDDYDEDSQEFFFDRSPSAFGMIVSFLAAGRLALLRETCVLAFREELAYWGIEEAHLDRCCLHELLRRLEQLSELRQQEALHLRREAGRPAGEPSRWGVFMNWLRETVENPRSGLPGKVFACLSILFVATTAVSLCVSTMPDLRAEEDKVSGPLAARLRAHECDKCLLKQQRKRLLSIGACVHFEINSVGRVLWFFVCVCVCVRVFVLEEKTHEVPKAGKSQEGRTWY